MHEISVTCIFQNPYKLDIDIQEVGTYLHVAL